MKKYRAIAAIMMLLVLCAGCAPHGGEISVSLIPTPTQEPEATPVVEELPVVPLEGLETESPAEDAAAEETNAPAEDAAEPAAAPVTPKPEPTATAKPAATESPKPTQEVQPTATAEPTAEPTAKPAVTATAKPTATATAAPAATPTQAPTQAPAATEKPSDDLPGGNGGENETPLVPFG